MEGSIGLAACGDRPLESLITSRHRCLLKCGRHAARIGKRSCFIAKSSPFCPHLKVGRFDGGEGTYAHISSLVWRMGRDGKQR